MIDIDDSRLDSSPQLTDPVDYYIANFERRNLFRFILTHPDMDHISGLRRLSQAIDILNFWDTQNNKTIEESTWERSPFDKRDWDRYQEFRRSTESPKCLCLHQGAQSDCCWVQDQIQILAPTRGLVQLANKTEEYNHLSYVLRISYAGVHILAGGDASVECWDEIYRTGGPSALRADILLAPHHGSQENVNEEVFRHIDPAYVLVSVVEGVKYDYEFYSRLARKAVLSTKYYGNILVTIREDGSYEPITVERNA